MPRYKQVNNELIEITGTELTELEAKEQAWIDDEFDRALDGLRDKRNNLLAETDWMANSDVTMSDAMRTYRQALRDITNGITTVEQVNDVVFPTKPSE
jgi:uncharacterized protein with von Willebrand factor type A (vWA) domain